MARGAYLGMLLLAASLLGGCDGISSDSGGPAYDPHSREMISWPTTTGTFRTGRDSLQFGGTAHSEAVYPSDPPTGPTVVTWSNLGTGESGDATVSRHRASAWPFGVFDVDDWGETITFAVGLNVIRFTATMADGGWAFDEVTVEYDPAFQDPAVEIASPVEDIFLTDSPWLTLSGTWSTGWNLQSVSCINESNGYSNYTGVQEWETAWGLTVHLKSGDNVITVTAEDGTGNLATDVIIVTYTPPVP